MTSSPICLVVLHTHANTVVCKYYNAKQIHVIDYLSFRFHCTISVSLITSVIRLLWILMEDIFVNKIRGS
jgi:hypothetical protein